MLSFGLLRFASFDPSYHPFSTNAYLVSQKGQNKPHAWLEIYIVCVASERRGLVELQRELLRTDLRSRSMVRLTLVLLVGLASKIALISWTHTGLGRWSAS